MLSPLQFSAFLYKKPPKEVPCITIENQLPGRNDVTMYVTAPQATPALKARDARDVWKMRHHGEPDSNNPEYAALQMAYMMACRALGNDVLRMLGGRVPDETLGEDGDGKIEIVEDIFPGHNWVV